MAQTTFRSPPLRMRLALDRTRVETPESLSWRDGVALGLCAVYGLALVAFHRIAHDVSLRVYDFLRHAELAHRFAEGRIEVDGFYPLGYPALLAAGVRLGPDVFVVGKVLSTASAMAVLFVSQRLVGKLLPDGGQRWLPLLAMIAVGLSPTFVQYATTPGTDMPHLALLLASCWLVLEAFDAPRPQPWLLAAGFVGGLSYLIRYTSLLIIPALGLWLLLAYPWGRATWRRGGAYLLAFFAAAAPQLVLSAIQRGSPFYTTTLAKNVWVGNYAGPLPELTWGEVADTVSLLSVIRAGPGHFLLNWGNNIVAPTFGNDLAGLLGWYQQIAAGAEVAVTGPTGLAGIVPGILKIGALLCAGTLVLRGADWVPDLGAKAGFLAIFALLFTAATALAFVTERHLLPVIPLLIVLAFAALSNLAEQRWARLIGVCAIALLAYHLAAFGYPDRWLLGYGHAAQASAVVRAQGGAADAVYTTNWGFYDYDARWLDHYEHLPIGVASVDELVALMRARHIHYLVYDRNGGMAQWPQLEGLLHPEREPGGLRLIADPILSREAPPNLVLVYALP